MSTISVGIPDEHLAKLKERARQLGLQPEDLVRLSVDEMLNGTNEKFENAAARVLKKNAELYRRLADADSHS